MFNRLRAFAQTTTVLGVAMIVLIWGGVVFHSAAERDHAYEAGLRQGNNLTRIFETYISQVVKGTDSALLALRQSYEHTVAWESDFPCIETTSLPSASWSRATCAAYLTQ